jgi:hypothetical protein
MKFNKLFTTTFLITFCFITTSCENLKSLIDDTYVSSSKEQNAYLDFQKVYQLRGDKPSLYLKNWANKLSKFNDITQEISEKLLYADQEEIQKAAHHLVSLKVIFKHKANRKNYNYSNMLIPSWKINEAKAAKDSFLRQIKRLKENYLHIFGENLEFTNEIKLSYTKDKKIIDTFPICVQMMNDTKDETCMKIAQISCGHQVNIKCLSNLIQNNEAVCSKWVNVINNNNPEDEIHGRVTNQKVTLKWPSKILTKCQDENKVISK